MFIDDTVLWILSSVGAKCTSAPTELSSVGEDVSINIARLTAPRIRP